MRFFTLILVSVTATLCFANERWTIGGHLRQRLQVFENPAFVASNDDTQSYWLQRFRADLGYQLTDRITINTSLQAAFDEGGDGGHSSVEENRLDWQQAYLQLNVSNTVDVHLGRQEWRFGSQRLIGWRDGTNVRRSFDGVRLHYRKSDWQVEGFAARPTQFRLGAFDDTANDSQSLWGIYSTYDMNPSYKLEFYYVGNRIDYLTYANASGEETRHSLGTRLERKQSGWDLNWEALMQFGEVGVQDIRAYTFASISGYTFERLRWRPRLVLSSNIASGDDDPNDEKLSTFRAMYPRGNYFSDAALLGPANFYNFHGFVTVQPRAGLTITGDLNFYQRLETRDGIYGPAGDLLFAAGSNEGHGVSRSWDLNIEYQPLPQWTITAIFTQLDPRSFVTAQLEARRMRFFEFTVKYYF